MVYTVYRGRLVYRGRIAGRTKQPAKQGLAWKNENIREKCG
jgi:hypothetical protein